MMQVALLEEQKNEAAENEGTEKVDEESKPIDADSGAAEATHKNETLDENPDINDVPMEESQVNLFMSLLFTSCFSTFSSIFLKYRLESNNCSPQSILHRLKSDNEGSDLSFLTLDTFYASN